MTIDANPEEPTLPVSAAEDVISWIERQPFSHKGQHRNYTVGLTDDGNMIISKENGITEDAEGMRELREMIGTTDWYHLYEPTVYLAQFFNGDGGGNHGEMCVLAAADRLRETLKYVLCSGDNCLACYGTMSAYEVESGNDPSARPQQSWMHPRGRLMMGTGLTAPWPDQLAELGRYNACDAAGRATFAYKDTKRCSTRAEGQFQVFLPRPGAVHQAASGPYLRVIHIGHYPSPALPESVDSAIRGIDIVLHTGTDS